MSTLVSIPAYDKATFYDPAGSKCSVGSTPAVLADIYEPDVNLSVWRGAQKTAVRAEAELLCRLRPGLKLALSGDVDSLLEEYEQRLQLEQPLNALNQRIRECLILFRDLFEPPAMGLRLEILDHAMCPRFHVDHLAARMITTFCGPATQWLPNEAVDRSWLGPAGANKKDESSGVIRDLAAIQQLQAGDVAIMKGDGWEGNEGRGLVHRSPASSSVDRRVVLTIDWVA